MNPFLEVLTRMMPRSEKMLEIGEITVPKSYEDYLKWQCDTYNKATGELTGYDCPECLNKGYISAIKDGEIVQRECRCVATRNSILRLKKSGLGEIAERYTFDGYRTPEEWQKRAKSKAMQYVSENPDKWLFFGGQSGCGKTHLCTAVCVGLIEKCMDVKYVLWRNLMHFLESKRFSEEKNNSFSEGKYNDKINELQNVEVLYIDDFLKTARKDKDGKIAPSEMELNSAYEIINARAISGKKTIISSELHINDITVLDEATGGRISEASEGFQIQIKREKGRNYRFGGKE